MPKRLSIAAPLKPPLACIGLAVFLLMLSIANAQGQQPQGGIPISSRFARHTSESTAKGIVFNALWVKNRGNKHENLTLNLTVPIGWRLIGDEQMELHLAPGDSTVIPIRVAVGAMVRGDIGYSIVASLNDNQGNTIKNDYCFVKIPGIYDIIYKMPRGIAYLDPVNRTSQFSVLVQNNGNRDETVNFLLDGNRLLGIGLERSPLVSYDIVVPPFTDTTVTFSVTHNGADSRGRNMFPLNLQLSSPHSSTKRMLWFRSIESVFVNQIDAMNRPLTVELNVQGLLNASVRPIYSATIFGRTLFKGNNDMYYYYRNYASSSPLDLYYKSRVYLGANLGRWNIELGDNFRHLEGNMNGRGAYVAYKGQRAHYVALANKALETDRINTALRTEVALQPNLTLIVGANYSQQASINYRSTIGYGGIRHSIQRNNYQHLIQTIGNYNLIERQLNGKQKHHQWGASMSYTSRWGSTSHSLLAEHYTPLYNSYKAGTTSLILRSTWFANERNRLTFHMNERINKNNIINNDTISSTSANQNGEYHLEYQYQLSRSIQSFYGPLYRHLSYRADNPSFRPGANLFISHNLGAIAGLRITPGNGSVLVVPRIEIATPIITRNPYPSDTIANRVLRRITYQHFSINIRSPHIGLIALFTTGPRNQSDQLNYANNGTNTRRLIIIPSYYTTLLNNRMHFTASANYNNDLISKFSYLALNGKTEFYFPRNWYLNFMMQYNMQRRIRSAENFEQYQTLYAEATIRKEFGFQQPRVRYHNVDMVFFKDFNGDQTQNENEPGIKNVLVSIERIDDPQTQANIPHNISTAELLSNNLGHVRFENIPEGIYRISYNPLGNETGSFSKVFDNVELHITKSGVHHFPFSERNKVFGRIIMNRSKLSNLGNIDISNIRITAADSRGNVFSTLTDKNGEFTIFAPSTDEYIVNINNIFHENFDLRQNNFHVQFNGYRQFEVNYVFDEKARQINFSQTDVSSFDDLGTLENTQQIRRTTLRGIVKDAATLAPIRARINLLNASNNIPVQSVIATASTGEFGMSFVASEEYVLEVQADGYWRHSENLVLNQMTTFMTLTREITLNPINIGSYLEVNTQFDANSTAISPSTMAELNRILRVLRANSQIQIEVLGHADDAEQRINPRISEQRAMAVAKYLREHGFTNVKATGRDNLMPIAPNNTEANRARNRRIDIMVVGK